LWLQLAVTGALAQVLDGRADVPKAQSAGVLDNRRHETNGSRHGDGHVDGVVLADDDVAALLTPAGVGRGDLAGRDGDSLDEEIVDAQLVSAAGRRIQSRAELQQLAHRDG